MSEKAKEEPRPEPRYRVLQGFSVRKHPGDTGSEEFVQYAAGERHNESIFPPHADLKALMRSGHLEREEE